jgi:folylpolyglutamate synthase/dihydropteroate synthase
MDHRRHLGMMVRQIAEERGGRDEAAAVVDAARPPTAT